MLLQFQRPCVYRGCINPFRATCRRPRAEQQTTFVCRILYQNFKMSKTSCRTNFCACPPSSHGGGGGGGGGGGFSTVFTHEKRRSKQSEWKQKYTKEFIRKKIRHERCSIVQHKPIPPSKLPITSRPFKEPVNT